MGLFGKSFEEKVDEALAQVAARHPEVKGLRATVQGKVVTLTGECPSLEVKTKVMAEFNALVETENTINTIRVAAPAPPPAPAPVAPPPGPAVEAAPVAPAERVHVVEPGDTLSAIAKKYYGKAGLYMKIFEANRDLLDNPDRIRPGQRLRIPE